MGLSSSKPLKKPNNPLQEIQYKESQRERTRLQQEKEKKQIARLQKKQAKKQRKTKRKQQRKSSRSQTDDHLETANNTAAAVSIHQRDSTDTTINHSSFNYHTMRYDFRREDINRQLEAKIQKLLNEDLCEFILNQMSLTMQFFKNYERLVVKV